jgi:hypothetical protein
MQAFIAVMGILVTLLVVAGMILMAPAGAEPDTAREVAAVPLAGDVSP